MRRQLHPGPVHRIGRKLAAYGDLQRLVVEVIKKNCRIGASTRILEVGCGSAPVAGRLCQLTPLVYGVDVSPAAARLTRQTGVKASVADVMDLPFDDHSFDLVYTTGMVDLFDDTEAALILGEITRVIRPGGCIIVITAWSRCYLHESIKEYLIKKGRWSYGPKRAFDTLEHLLPDDVMLRSERPMGALFQLRFLSYLFEEQNQARRLYHLFFLLFSVILWPLNRLPGALLVSVLEKNEVYPWN